MEDVFKKPQGSCFPTLVGQKKLAVTRIDEKERLLEINHVLVSQPDMPIQAPICDAISNLVSDANDPKIIVEWTRIIHLLSSHRIVLFAIGLKSVINRILADHKSLSSVTIFAPSEFEFVASSSPILEKIVRFHVLPLRVTYIELAALPHKQSLMTLLPCEDLEIINGANVT
ncbi:fasciclin-like arabinogalactan protein 21 [Populus nigra]|uniref:fasciclin-like arabinogalactan protein 21 n=1 Tax=Populus nigra TaxID=3691 RepID=UPI002B2685F2|nr:fasciclin-like arabinogalactan protein 21 [Populus nigra]